MKDPKQILQVESKPVFKTLFLDEICVLKRIFKFLHKDFSHSEIDFELKKNTITATSKNKKLKEVGEQFSNLYDPKSKLLTFNLPPHVDAEEELYNLKIKFEGTDVNILEFPVHIEIVGN